MLVISLFGLHKKGEWIWIRSYLRLWWWCWCWRPNLGFKDKKGQAQVTVPILPCLLNKGGKALAENSPAFKGFASLHSAVTLLIRGIFFEFAGRIFKGLLKTNPRITKNNPGLVFACNQDCHWGLGRSVRKRGLDHPKKWKFLRKFLSGRTI